MILRVARKVPAAVWAPLLLATVGCGAGESSDAETLARMVVIHRDGFGVPHVHGETDAAAVFGYLYTQAEDAFDEVETHVASMTGRLAEIEGEGGLRNDLLVRALETERWSREEYARAESAFRAIADAWAAGLNHYLDTHPEVTPVLGRFEPWQMFAVARSESFWAPNGFTEAMWDPVTFEADGTLRVAGGRSRAAQGIGSNFWLIGPRKAVGAEAMIFLNPHSPPEAYLEGHLLSDEGLNVHGAARAGRPFPVLGHTPRHAWSLTNNSIDVDDLWRESFDHPTDPLAYRYGDGWRRAEEWSDTIRVRTDAGLEAREVRFRRTHRGPVVAGRAGGLLSLRIARWEEGGAAQQFHAMAGAVSFEAFRSAVARQHLIWLSIGYADADGNIWYVFNGSPPSRDPAFDWTRPVDGADPRTDWRGYHELSELPQVLNPHAGWILSTNHSPFRVTADGENPSPEGLPPYLRTPDWHIGMQLDSLGDNARARASRRILSGVDRFTFEAWADSTMSTRAWEADADLPAWRAEWEALQREDPDRAADLAPVMDTLRAWDRVFREESVASTLYALTKLVSQWSWAASLEPPPFGPTPAFGVPVPPWGRWSAMAGLETVVAHLEREWGRWAVPYGDLVRLQRSPDGSFRDASTSIPLTAGPEETGVIRYAIPLPVTDQRRWYLFASALSYGSVARFGQETEARTVNGSGQSSDPASSHYDDQAELYGRGGYKPVPLTLEEVRAVAEESYRPGERRDE
ncbi:MAG TPA: penicillin acylase family protein [Longimicrobiales bacterium]|nr:penicillin acylase family protein [Longimicrobiales bacterium]